MEMLIKFPLPPWLFRLACTDGNNKLCLIFLEWKIKRQNADNFRTKLVKTGISVLWGYCDI